MDKIVIKGCRQHNLKNIDLEIPRDKLVVITGLSGSGKSSLAFDTIYAEGQRRYVESLSAYARQFLEQMDKPDVDSIEGLSPAIAIEQKTTSKNPRSTVGTVTEIYDYLRLLYARIGKPYCYICGREIASQTVQQITDAVMALPEGTRIQVLAPIVRGRKGEYKKELLAAAAQGYVRARVDGTLRELSEPVAMDKKKKHDIEIVIDRLVVKPGIERRLAESVETALHLAEGLALINLVDKGEDRLFSAKLACIVDEISYPELAPNTFSFNSPQGACPTCDGIGGLLEFDAGLIVPNTNLSLREGAVKPWAKRSSVQHFQMLQNIADICGFDINASFRDLAPALQEVLLHGAGNNAPAGQSARGRKNSGCQSFEGIIKILKRRYDGTDSFATRWELEQYMSYQPCPDCNGSRLRKESLAVKVAEKNIHEVTRLSIRQALSFFTEIALSDKDAQIAQRILKEIRERLGFLVHVGLNYLTLDRASATLSGGEGQRIRLATQIGSSLVGVLYILDEPSIGLHQRDNRRLLDTLVRLRDLGNTVLVVEHDEETIRSADHVIDMGPGAGIHGGEIVAQGTPKQIEANPRSITGRYLSGKASIPLQSARRKPRHFISVLGAGENNLKNITVRFPLGVFTCVTGVSGSGKSTLVVDILYRALAQQLYRSTTRSGQHRDIKGLEHIDKVIDIDQSPIGRTPRSNPATYTGLFTPIRDLFTQLPESRMRGYKAGRYSFNVKGGRCEACEGDGLIKIEMHFLPDVYVTCDVCHGSRYNRETLDIRYKSKNIAEVLAMTVEQALEFFQAIPSIKTKLQTLSEVGLGYITLGQFATTLSGGEAQRVKLSRELSRRATGRTLYILDEPTTGLHFEDTKKLLDVLGRLVDSGNTVVVIEHNLDVVKTSDWIIDLGPEGGDAGGEIVAEGTPEDVVKVNASYTGQFLKAIL
ncbi:MAG: excinuclease ABC subunit A [Nitrospirae bacterium GWC1_57_7]|nr:MAG: excinuclease ABC subunit A [Nitrospirae bacterium GWC1_57_7]